MLGCLYWESLFCAVYFTNRRSPVLHPPPWTAVLLTSVAVQRFSWEHGHLTTTVEGGRQAEQVTLGWVRHTHFLVEVKVSWALLGNVMLRLMNLTTGTSVCQTMVVSGLPFRVAYLKLPLFSSAPAGTGGVGLRCSKGGFTAAEEQHASWQQGCCASDCPGVTGGFSVPPLPELTGKGEQVELDLIARRL